MTDEQVEANPPTAVHDILAIVDRNAKREARVRTFSVILALLLAAAVLYTGWQTINNTRKNRESIELLESLVRAQKVELDGRLAEEAKDKAAGQQRVDAVIAGVDEIITEGQAEHDARALFAHTDLLNKISQLLGRPAGILIDPVAATVTGEAEPAPAPAPRQGSGTTAAPAPAPRPAPTPTPAPTTTVPSQRSCVERPSGPRC